MAKGKNEIIYAYPSPNEEQKQGETPIYKSSILEKDEPLATIAIEGIDTLKKQFYETVENYRDDPFLGTRTVVDNDEEGHPVYGKYEFVSYGKVFQDVINLAKSFVGMKLYSEVNADRRNMKMIGIYSKNNEGWTYTDLACVVSGLITVTLYDTLGGDSSEYIIKQAELKTVVCTVDHVEALLEIKARANHLENIVIIGPYQEDQLTK